MNISGPKNRGYPDMLPHQMEFFSKISKDFDRIPAI
jgi:hypothetical protein